MRTPFRKKKSFLFTPSLYDAGGVLSTVLRKNKAKKKRKKRCAEACGCENCRISGNIGQNPRILRRGELYRRAECDRILKKNGCGKEICMKTKAKLLVSACLLGRPCRYDGRSCPSDAVGALSDQAEWVPVCPEVMGGLPTPRVPCERQKEGGILAKDGNWRTEEYRKGAEEAVRIARENGCRAALLKEKSPSCGVHCIYDGSFGGRLNPCGRPGSRSTPRPICRTGQRKCFRSPREKKTATEPEI